MAKVESEGAMAGAAAHKPPPLTLGTKVAFGVGSASESAFYIAYNIFCFFYFVQVLELPAALAGLAAAVALIFDAISDPMIGYLSDRWKPGKLGRRHPFMLVSALPLGFAWMALFSPPEGLGVWALFSWLVFFSVLARICQTIFYVPHIAMGSELDGDYAGRSRVFAWHIIFLWAGGASVHFFGLRYFFSSEILADGTVVDGRMLAENYPLYGAVWGVVMVAIILISTLFTISRIPHLKRDMSAQWDDENDPDAPIGGFGHHFGQLLVEFKEVLGNRNYLIVVLGLFSQAIGAGVYETLISHMIKYVWELSTEQFSLIAFASMLGFIIGFVLVVPLHKRLGKCMVLGVTTFIMGIAHVLPVAMKLANVPLEPGSTAVLYLVLGSAGVFYGAQSLMLASIVSVIGDIADEHELNTGRRREGILYSSRTLFSKVSSAGGHLIAGLMLSLIAFPLGKDIMPSDVPPQVLTNFMLIYVLLIPVPYVVATVLYLRYRIDATRHSQIVRLLEERHAGQSVTNG